MTLISILIFILTLFLFDVDTAHVMFNCIAACELCLCENVATSNNSEQYICRCAPQSFQSQYHQCTLIYIFGFWLQCFSSQRFRQFPIGNLEDHYMRACLVRMRGVTPIRTGVCGFLASVTMCSFLQTLPTLLGFQYLRHPLLSVASYLPFSPCQRIFI